MELDPAHSRRSGQLALLAALAMVAAGCQTAGVPRGAALPTSTCMLTTGPAPASLTFALNDPVIFTTAPLATNGSQRTVYRQLYETLVTIDCAGFVRPGLAASWSGSDAGRVWQFRLRPRAAFWDGAPVTASAVAASWSANPLFTSVSATDESTLRVELQAPRSDAQFFAQTGLAVIRRDSSAPWPIGSGPYRPVEASGSTIRLVSRDGNVLEFKPFADARRALDAGVDALVTADVAALDYARALPAYTLTAAPWSRTYVLVTNGENSDTLMPPTDAMSALARDAVRADTRPAMAPFAWRDPPCTSTLAGPPVNATLHGRAIVYPRGDATARGIAERLVALAWPASRAPAWLSASLYGGAPGSSPPSTLALEPVALRDAIRKGDPLALVAPLPRACAALAADSVGIMLAGGRFHFTPLLDARDYLVHHNSVGTVTIDADGTLRFSGHTP